MKKGHFCIFFLKIKQIFPCCNYIILINFFAVFNVLFDVFVNFFDLRFWQILSQIKNSSFSNIFIILLFLVRFWRRVLALVTKISQRFQIGFFVTFCYQLVLLKAVKWVKTLQTRNGIHKTLIVICVHRIIDEAIIFTRWIFWLDLHHFILIRIHPFLWKNCGALLGYLVI